jgi:hypothetical protein
MSFTPPFPSAKRFTRLYNEVTDRLREHAGERLDLRLRQPPNGISQAEYDWYEQLIKGFAVEMGNWVAPHQPDVSSYLKLFEGHSLAVTKVSGHAFLHVAYDLPRVIADSFAHFPAIPVSRMRALFLQPAPIFRQAFKKELGKGTLGPMLVPLRAMPSIEMLAFWVTSMRSVAWIHAEILADPAMNRKAVEANLAAALLEAGRTAMKKNFLFRLPKLDNSILLQTPLATAVLGGRVTLAAVLAVSLLGLGTALAQNSAALRMCHLAQIFSAVAPGYIGKRR